MVFFQNSIRTRSGAAITAVLLLVGVLVLLPGSASGGEDPSTRQFAGATRYETSLTVAQQYYKTAREAGNPSTTAIIASGESLIDAATAAGLAQVVNAPVLLTRTDEVFIPAAHLIEREAVKRIIVVGGEAAVSARVFSALSTVPGVTSVERLSGADRFATAAQIAAFMKSTASYCSQDGKAAILVVGDGSSFADIIIAGPVSYSAGIPILLTSTSRLVTETLAALKSLDIKHVVIVGGEYSFAADEDENAAEGLAQQKAALSETGIQSTTHYGGDNHFDTAVAVLNAIEVCQGSAEFDKNNIALVSEVALPDGISAAPLLGQGLNGDGKATPLLLVGSNRLPPEIASYLAKRSSPAKIVPIGGAEAISGDTIDAADNATSGVVDTTTTSAPRRRSRDGGGNGGGGNGGNGGGGNGGSGPSVVTTPLASSRPVTECRLDGTSDFITAGFPLPSTVVSSTGEYKVAVVFVDFPNADPTYTTQQESDGQLPKIKTYLEAMSYGQLSVVFEVRHGWVRMRSNWEDYEPDEEIASEVLETVDADIDFSDDIDALMIVRPSYKFERAYAFTRGSIGSGSYFNADGVPIGNVSVINAFYGIEVNGNPRSWWQAGAHEMSHGLGLLDLYPYEEALRTPDQSTAGTGKAWQLLEIGTMQLWSHIPYDFLDFVQTADFGLPYLEYEDIPVESIEVSKVNPFEMLAWSRWQLGWLAEDEVECITEESVNEEITLSPIAAPSGKAAIIIPLPGEKGLVLESRRDTGYDDVNGGYAVSFDCAAACTAKIKINDPDTYDFLVGGDDEDEIDTSGIGLQLFEVRNAPFLRNDGILVYEVRPDRISGQLPLALLPQDTDDCPTTDTTGCAIELEAYPILDVGSEITYDAGDDTEIVIRVVSDDTVDADGVAEHVVSVIRRPTSDS